jgi:hypothetical protein
MNTPIDIGQAFATLFALITVVGVVPNLFWFNWRGIIAPLVCAVLAYNFHGWSLTWMFLGLVLSGCFWIASMHRSMAR